MSKEIREMQEQLKQINILVRINNILLSKFINQLQEVKKRIRVPDVVSFFRFDIYLEDYKELCKEFEKKDVDKALFWLDRQLIQNKMACPSNVKSFVLKRLTRQKIQRRKYDVKRKKQKEQQEEVTE